MNIERLKQLEELKTKFDEAISVCDPIEYQIRRRDLLYGISIFLLNELDEYRDEIIKSSTQKE